MTKNLILIFVIAFVFRLFLINIAHHGDLNNNISWGNEALVHPLNGYYEGKSWPYSAPNQPPLYILLFAATSLIYKSVANLNLFLNDKVGIFPSSFVWFWQKSGMDIVVKLPSILSDLGIAVLIYKFLAGKKLALVLATVWLFNPISWYLSGIWGQTDSIVNLLGLISILFLLKKDLIKFSIFYTLSILFKPSLLIFIPIILFVVIYQKHKLNIWLLSILFSLLCTLLVSVWFHPRLDLPVWLFNLYKDRFISGEIGDLQANAFNLWWLIDNKKTLDSTVYFGLPARIWGYILSIAGIVTTLFFLKRNSSKKNILITLALSALITFLFMTRIHERYLYPFFPLATISLAFFDWLIIPYIILSVTNLLNLYHLFYAPSIPFLENLYTIQFFSVLLAFSNILVFLYFVFYIKNSN